MPSRCDALVAVAFIQIPVHLWKDIRMTGRGTANLKLAKAQWYLLILLPIVSIFINYVDRGNLLRIGGLDNYWRIIAFDNAARFSLLGFLLDLRAAATFWHCRWRPIVFLSELFWRQVSFCGPPPPF